MWTFNDDYITWSSRRKHEESFEQLYITANYEDFVN